MRKRGRTDGNQTEIVKVFRSMGCSVAITSGLGGGFPDIVVGVCGVNLLIEIKDGSAPASQQKLTSDEKEWHNGWKGIVHIVSSEDDAIGLINNIRWRNKP